MGAAQNFDVNDESQNPAPETAPASPPPRSSGGRNIAIVGVVAVVVVVMLWSAARHGRQTSNGCSGPVASAQGLVGCQAPAFTLKTMDGATAHLADYKG